MVYPKLADQFSLEEEMKVETRARYFRNHAKAEERDDLADTHAGRSIFDHLYYPFLEAIQERKEKVGGGGPGRKNGSFLLVKDFDDDPTLAYIFLRSLINTTLTLQQRDKKKIARMTRVALTVSVPIHDELRIRHFKEQRPALLRKIVADFQKKDLPRRRRRELMIKQFHTQQLDWEAPGWSQSSRLQLGVVLLDLFRQSTGAIEEWTYYEGKRSINCVTFTEDMTTAIQNQMDRAADFFTVYFPTIIPPRPGRTMLWWVAGTTRNT